jgi:hypothetical protein
MKLLNAEGNERLPKSRHDDERVVLPKRVRVY